MSKLLVLWGRQRRRNLRIWAVVGLGLLSSGAVALLLGKLVLGWDGPSAGDDMPLMVLSPLMASVFRLLITVWYPIYVYLEEGPHVLRRRVQSLSRGLVAWLLLVEGGLVLGGLVGCVFLVGTSHARALLFIPVMLAAWGFGWWPTRQILSAVALGCGGAVTARGWQGIKMNQSLREAGFHNALDVYRVLRAPVRRYGLSELQMSITGRGGALVPFRPQGLRVHHLLEIWLALGDPRLPSEGRLASSSYSIELLDGPSWSLVVTNQELSRILSHLPRALTLLSCSIGRGMTYRLIEDVVQETAHEGTLAGLPDQVQSVWIRDGTTSAPVSDRSRDRRDQLWQRRESRMRSIVDALRQRGLSQRRIAQRLGFPVTAVANMIGDWR